MIGNIHKNQFIASFFNMTSLNIYNHIKSSLEFVLRGTAVFLRYFGSFSNQRQFQNLHTRVCNGTSLCLQQRPHREVRSPTKTTHRRQKFNKDHKKGRSSTKITHRRQKFNKDHLLTRQKKSE